MFKFTCLLLSFFLIGFFCESRTKRFRYADLLTCLTNRPDWEVIKPETNELQNLRARLDQTFDYLGAGEQSVAFLGKDGKTVLKFFKHGQPWKETICQKLPVVWQKKINKMHLCRPFSPDNLFRSCKIAFEDLKEETGLLYLHLNKTERRWGKAILYDAIEVKHEIDLDKTEFIVQEYSELALSVIYQRMKEGQIESAKTLVLSLLESIENYCRKGVHVDRPAIHRNVGFKDGKVILLDIGSFRKSEDFKTDEALQKELIAVSARLERWLRKYHPVLLPVLKDHLQSRGV